MLISRSLTLCALFSVAMWLGCARDSSSTASSGNGDSTAAETAQADSGEGEEASLSAEDQALADAQMVCPVGGDLGGMGTPVKVMVEDKPVFLCCEHCREEFLSDTDGYLAKLEKKIEEAKEAKAAKASEEAETPAEESGEST